MRVSVVLLLLCLSSVHLHRAVDQLVVGDEQTEFTQSQIEELKKQYAGLEGSVDSTELSAEEPGEENSRRRKVAFSYASGLKGSLGPCNSNVIVPFHKKITDVGNAFNSVTGVFTAPRRGVYYFRFNLHGSSFFYSLAACLYKNHEKILDVTKSPRGWYKYVVGGATLLLRKGDHVYVKLKRRSQIHDDNGNHCTFSGFLLFSM
ncbi:complement C1q subcomponent subunit C-like [Pygocentrus nattereri]|uniref:complement C1q subcomponent subunit C-like n=1 Tax=Pygocentrus nattereri TaxID=42514 RepID=UPI001891A92F|nr:complement C1q subcomponent subunit C-like [Pygocentrus nattereri]